MVRVRLWSLSAALAIATAGAGVHLAIGGVGRGGLAQQMLDAVIVPRGAARAGWLPGLAFARPSQEPACTPLTDQVRYWAVRGDPAGVATFLTGHAPSSLRNNETGWLGSTGGAVISYQVGDVPRSRRLAARAELDFTVSALPGGMTGIRADAEVIPPAATCLRSGGPAWSGNAAPAGDQATAGPRR